MYWHAGLSVLLGAVLLWGSGHCQVNLNKLADRLSYRDAYVADLSENPDALTSAQAAMEELWTFYLPELLSNTSNGSSISQECIMSAESLLASSLLPNISMPPLVPLLDATGKIGAGVIGGNFQLVPAFDECFEYNYTGFCEGSGRLTFLPPTSPVTLRIGLCVPKNCSSSDVTAVLESTGLLLVEMRCTDRKHQAYGPGAIIMILVSLIFALLVLAATAVDQVKVWTAPKPQKVESMNNETGGDSTSSSGSIASTEKIPLVKRSVTVVPQTGCNIKVKPLEFLAAFSLYKTLPALFSTEQAAGVITSMNGLRVLSMFWVILGHTYDFVLLQTDNIVSFTDIVSRFSFQAIINANHSVDSFFFLSGVLVTYLTLRQMKRSGKFPFIHYYAHRYLRLTPSYAFVLFLGWHLFPHFATGPSTALPTPNACSSYWWTNLLYINNFHPWKLAEECAGWTWYLANDMQFYIVAPLIVIPLYYLFPVGLAVAGCFLLSGFIVTATLAGVYDFTAMNLNPDPTKPNYLDVLYTKPWGRISPYLVGLVFGFVMHRQLRFQFSRTVNLVLYGAVWVASGITLALPLYGLYFSFHGHTLSAAENVIYITLHRFSWGVGLALLVFACHSGYGGHINTFLSLKIWTPLSRMTLNAYLFHPIVIFTVYGQLQTSVHLTDMTMAVYSVAFVAISYAIAAVLCVCVELPLGTIEILLFKLIGVGGRESQRQATTASSSKKKREETVLVTQKEA